MKWMLYSVISQKNTCRIIWKQQKIVTRLRNQRFTLPKDANIYAQQYALCLPDKALLQQKLREWIAEFKQKEDEV